MMRPSAMDASRRGSTRDHPVRSSSTDSDRPKLGKSSKLGEGRSPRGTGPSNQSQKKLGTRIANLESQLGLAHEELKCLKDQLATTETAKKASQGQVEKNPQKQQIKAPEPLELETSMSKEDGSIAPDTSDDVMQETDVFEVSIENVASEPNLERVLNELEPKAEDISISNPLERELELKDDEINLLKENLSAEDAEMETILKENERLKNELGEKSEKLSLTQSKIDELTSRLDKVVQELEESKSTASRMNERLQVADREREELENEMTKLRVQTKQWRKAADAAAAVLAGDGRRISERCGSMDTNVFERVGGYGSYVGSPGLTDDCDYGSIMFGSEKRKGSSGIRMLGELWRKKGQK